jgi:hypothetical protein
MTMNSATQSSFPVLSGQTLPFMLNCIDSLKSHWSRENKQWLSRLALQATLSVAQKDPDMIFTNHELMAHRRAVRLSRQRAKASKESNRKLAIEGTLFDNVEPADLIGEVIHYGSGVLTPAYWNAYTSVNHPVCVTAVELGEIGLTRVCNYLEAGGSVLMDSGAFLFRNAFGDMPWAKVVKVYRAVSEAAQRSATPSKLTFILPDAVGSQSESLTALRLWGNRIQEAIGPDHKRLLPIQRGNMTPSLYISAAINALGNTPISGIAVPCKAKAFPAEYLQDLKNLTANIPQRAHFLGLSSNRKKLETYMVHLGEAWPDAVVTCDAVKHRAVLGQNEDITTMRHEIIAGPINDLVDRTCDTTEPLPDDLERKADHIVIRSYGSLDIRDARHQVIVDHLLEERWGAWATEVATRAFLTGLEPKILSSYWELVDAINEQ